MTEIKFNSYSNDLKVKINGTAVSHVISADVKFSSETTSYDSSQEYGEEGVSSLFGIKGTCEIVRSKLFSSDITDEEEISEISIENSRYRYTLTGCTLISLERTADLHDGEMEKYTYSVSQGKKVKI